MGPEQTPPPSNTGADWSDVLDRYYAGECSAEERVVVEAYLAPRPRIVQFFQVLRHVLDSNAVGEFDAAAGLEQVKQVAHQPIAARRHGQRPLTPAKGWPRRMPQDRRPRVIWSTVTAFAAAVIVAVVGWNVVMRHAILGSARAPLTYTTANGERATVTLPDGSTAALDVASRLDVPANYAAGHHTVRLVGEALFTVAHHGGTPFSVIAGGTTARVLGTSFIVRHYAQDTTTTVAVRDGKVAVRSVVLTAARQVVVGPAGVGNVQPANPAQFTFATGLLTLDDVRFPQAILELDRWYNADIRLGDPTLAAQAVTGEFAAGSLADLTDVLAGTFNVRVVRNGRVLTLYPSEDHGKQ